MMARPNEQLSSALVLAVVGGVVLAGLALDTVVAVPEPVAPTTTEAPLLAGSTTCAAMALDAASTVTASAVAAPREDAPEAAAALRLEADGEVRPLAPPAVDGGVATTPVIGDDRDAAVTARWERAPLLLSRRWQVDETQRVPGTVEGPCPAAPATEWVVPGIATAGGASGGLFIANPTEGSASLAITFTTPDGPVAPTRLANIAVPAHTRIGVDLNQFLPEEPDVGVVVTTRSGRVVVEGVQVLEAAVGGVDGRSLVAAQSAPAEVWTIPWVNSSEQETAWVWVTNPGEEPTDVRLVLHTETGPVVPPDSGVTLPPGTTRRIDLRGALAEVGTGAVTVRSAPGVPVVASGAVLRSVEDDAERGGIAVVEALPATPGLHAAQSAVGASGQARFLSLANPTEADAVVDVRVVGRSAAAATTVAGGLVVPAGTWVRVELEELLPEEGGFAVVVDATEGAVAATMVAAATEGTLDLMAIAARPFPRTILVTDAVVARDRRLLHPLGPAAGDEAGPDDASVTFEDADDAPASGTVTEAPEPTEDGA